MSISNLVKKYCNEELSKIENYDKAVSDKTQIWDCHHRLEIQGDNVFSTRDLMLQGLYYNRPASELIFLTHPDHVKLHSTGKNNPFYGKQHTEDTKNKISQHHKGKHYSIRTEFKKGQKQGPMSEETKRKLSETRKGKHYSVKTEFKKGHIISEEVRRKISETLKKYNREKHEKATNN